MSESVLLEVIDDTQVATVLPPLVLGPQARPPAEDPAHVYLASLLLSGRRAMAARLRTVAACFGATDWRAVPWEQLRYAHVAAIRARLQEPKGPDTPGLSVASVNATLAALRGVAQAAWSLGLLDVEELERIRSVKLVRGTTLPAGRNAAPGELRALLEACAHDVGPAGPRDAALIALLYAAGLRRSEVAGLQLADYEGAARRLTVRHGKGQKERALPLASGAAAALEAWLALRGRQPGALFLPITKSGTLGRRGLTAQAVYNALAKRAAEARLTEPLSPHDLRRTFVGDLLDAGADISTVQQLAGHANVTTTTRYDRRGEVTKRRAVDLLHVPYVPKG